MNLRYKDKRKIQTYLRDEAAQENCDGEPYDAMLYAAEVIDKLLKENNELREALSYDELPF